MLTHGALIRLCRARDLLRDVHDQSPSIRDVAREAGMSPYHFIRQFESLFGRTPHQYRIDTRIEYAKRLLALSDYSVTDVCMEVGCSSLGSFSDLFTRRVGVAPTVYRRQIRPLVTVPGELPVSLTPGCLTLMGIAFATFEKQPFGGSVTV